MNVSGSICGDSAPAEYHLGARPTTTWPCPAQPRQIARHARLPPGDQRHLSRNVIAPPSSCAAPVGRAHRHYLHMYATMTLASKRSRYLACLSPR